MSTTEERLAEVIGAHTICWNGSFGQYECTEDDAKYEVAEHCDAEEEHAAHLTAVVLAHLTAEGWAQGQEEFAVKFPTIGIQVQGTREQAEKLVARDPRRVLMRRFVGPDGDWERVEEGS